MQYNCCGKCIYFFLIPGKCSVLSSFCFVYNIQQYLPGLPLNNTSIYIYVRTHIYSSPKNFFFSARVCIYNRVFLTLFARCRTQSIGSFNRWFPQGRRPQSRRYMCSRSIFPMEIRTCASCFRYINAVWLECWK